MWVALETAEQNYSDNIKPRKRSMNVIDAELTVKHISLGKKWVVLKRPVLGRDLAVTMWMHTVITMLYNVLLYVDELLR